MNDMTDEMNNIPKKNIKKNQTTQSEKTNQDHERMEPVQHNTSSSTDATTPGCTVALGIGCSKS